MTDSKFRVTVPHQTTPNAYYVIEVDYLNLGETMKQLPIDRPITVERIY